MQCPSLSLCRAAERFQGWIGCSEELLAVNHWQDLLCREQSVARPQPVLLCVLLLEQLSLQPVLLCWCFLQGSSLDLRVLPQQGLSWPQEGAWGCPGCKGGGCQAWGPWGMVHGSARAAEQWLRALTWDMWQCPGRGDRSVPEWHP